jgi:hypothetical protein
MATRNSVVARNAALDAMAVLCNSGKLRYYTGAQPATPETAASGTLLCELTMNATAFGAAAAGVITAAAITSDASADSTGTAGWFRIFKSDGTTAVIDGSITTTGGGGQIEMPTTAIVALAQVDCTALTITLPM